MLGLTASDSRLVQWVYWQDLATVGPFSRSVPQQAPNAQDGSICIWDILASFVDSGRCVAPCYTVIYTIRCLT